MVKEKYYKTNTQEIYTKLQIRRGIKGQLSLLKRIKVSKEVYLRKGFQRQVKSDGL